MFESCSAALFTDSVTFGSLFGLAGCPPVLEVFIRGGLFGILGLAGLFNLILLSANPRNTSHLIFGAISLLATISVVLPYITAPGGVRSVWIEFQIFQVWLPVLLFWFVYVLFPALRRNQSQGTATEFLRANSRPFQMYLWACLAGMYLATPAAVGLVAGGLWMLYTEAAAIPEWVLNFAGLYFVFATICTAIVLIAASIYRQQGALVASVGFMCFALGMALDYSGSFEMNIPPRLPGVLGFVLAMVVLMGPNRYQMHRQLRNSRNVLRETNRKLRHLDVLKNRYITGSAREMQSPLEWMLEHCLKIVEDPAYRLGRSQLAALSGVMDMARKMIRRNERAAILFEETEIRARTFDAVNFFEMLVVILEEQLRPLQFSLELSESAGAEWAQIFADPTLIETAFVELAENAAAHGIAQHIRIRIAGCDHNPTRMNLEFHEEPSPRTADALHELTEEFKTRSPEDRSPEQNDVKSTPGIGLGLSLVRRIAENHGGQLQIKQTSTDANAVVFSFSVPRAGATGMRPPEVEWGLKHIQFLLMHDCIAQAENEARTLATRFPETREEVSEILADAAVPL